MLKLIILLILLTPSIVLSQVVHVSQSTKSIDTRGDRVTITEKGSGSIISHNENCSYILSCAHGWNPTKPVVIAVSKTKSVFASFVKVSKRDDLSLLKTETKIDIPALLLSEATLNEGDRVQMVGMTSKLKYTTLRANTNFLSVESKAGDSGGAVILDGKLVGVVVMTTIPTTDREPSRAVMVANRIFFPFLRSCPPPYCINGKCYQAKPFRDPRFSPPLQPQSFTQEAPPPPEYIRDIPDVDKVKRIIDLERQIAAISKKLQNIESGVDGNDGKNGTDGNDGISSKPFTIQFYSKSKRTNKEFKLGEVEITESGIYRVKLPDVIVEWIDPKSGNKISSASFPAGTPVRLMLTKEILKAAIEK
tara:strand:+ start:969 stop:2057 length:1089 start_codon:yes stop_codon:yes gene_type:complete